MSTLPRRARLAILLRSLSIQGSWNYQTLIGTGFAFVLLPALRRLHRGDEEALRAAVARHTELFNSHPYLVTVAAGAVARLEEEHTPPETIRRFKSALRGSLGSLGDRLVWLAWRPASALLAVVLLLAGGPWWLAVAAFLLAYNLLHLWLRVWGLRTGLREGLGVGKSLRDAPFQRLGDRASDAGALLAGFGVALAVGAGLPDALGPAFLSAGEYALAIVAAGVGLWMGTRVRRTVWAVLLAAWVLDLALVVTS